jgi:hypothetical protein
MMHSCAQIYSEAPASAGAAPKVVIPQTKQWLADWKWDDNDVDIEK